MNGGVLFLHLLVFLYIGVLPRIFFRQGGRLHLMWWLTAMPFLLDSVALVLAATGLLVPRPTPDPSLMQALALASVPFAGGSIALISFTLGTHRIPIALWHQSEDAPQRVVTHGAYRRVRHPFYAAFLLELVGTLLFLPHPITVVALIWGGVLLNLTAAREERRLCESEFGAEYRDYLERTGRFWPSWRRVRS